jgi:DNA-binding NarL/FixJ family response regulator
VGEATSGAEALDLVHRLRPEIVLMDINLPDMSGIELTQQISMRYPKVRVIGVSMHDAGDAAAAMHRAGACAFISKAAPVEELISALRQHCSDTGKPGRRSPRRAKI